MKNLILKSIFGLLLINFLIFLSCENNDQIELFEFDNNHKETIVSEYYDYNISQKIFLTTTPKNKLFSISILKNGEITPIAFYSENESDFKVYDLDGKLKINGTVEKTIAEINREEKNKFSSEKIIKIDFKSAKGDDCLGGSTWDCIQIAWDACNSDRTCRYLCIFSGWYCPSAIVTACAVQCI